MLARKIGDATSASPADRSSNTSGDGSPSVAAPFSRESQEPKTAVISRRIRQKGILSFFRRPKRPE